VPTPPDAPLTGLNGPVVAQELEGGRRGNADRGCLLEREIAWLLDQVFLTRLDEFGKCAAAPTEHLVAGPKTRDLRPDGLDRPCEVGSRNRVLRLSEAGGEAHHERGACHQDPVADMDGGRMHADQDVVCADLGQGDVPCVQDLGRAVTVLNDRLHHVSPCHCTL
jgi:hypothetical protein